MEKIVETVTCTRWIPAKFRRMIGPTERRYEVVSTEWIVDLCCSDPEFRSAFVGAIWKTIEVACPIDLALVKVSGQHRFGNYLEADIVIQDDRGKYFLVVEAKVDEPVDGFQLARYRDLPELIDSKAIIVSLARISADESLTTKQDLCRVGLRFLNWADLLNRLQRNRSKFRHPEIDSFFSFCDCIRLSQRIPTKRAKGPSAAELGLLNAVRNQLADWDCEPVERPPNISARLRVGRPAWKRIFGRKSYKRLLIYYGRRRRTGTGPPNIHFQILLFSENQHRGSRKECAPVIGNWLSSVHRSGLKDYGPKVGRRANDEDEKFRTEDTNEILRQEFWVTDDLNGATRVDNVLPDNVGVWMPKVLGFVDFYDRLVSSFAPACWGSGE